MIVPFPPGGLTDVLGRVLADGMQTSLGQTVVVENVGGASGSIGSSRVARAAADGYMVVLGIWNTHIVNNADARVLDRYVQSRKMVHAALVLLMLEAASTDLVSPSA
jgi:tripartite-type tricarboxylate transporter receptor subunit TctC